MSFERSTPDQITLWREDVAESRANLVIEDMTPTDNEDEMFALMLTRACRPRSCHRLFSASIPRE